MPARKSGQSGASDSEQKAHVRKGMSLVAYESPLYALVDIDDRQTAQLLSIAFSANALDAIYWRLAYRLEQAELEPVELVMADAWAMIDWTHRLDKLVRDCRGIAKGWPPRIDYRNSSSLVETQRHLFQHLEGTIPSLDMTGRAPWGHLAWHVPVPGDPTAVETRLLVPGHRGLGEDRDQSFRVPELRIPRAPIDYLALYSADGEAEIGLTGQIEALHRFIPALEAAVTSAPPPDPVTRILRIRGQEPYR